MKETVDYQGKGERFAGKPRSRHPYDRKSGTGRGKEVAKDGHGRGNWGNIEEEARFNSHTPSDQLLGGPSPKKLAEEGAMPENAEAIHVDLEKPPVIEESTKGGEGTYEDAAEEEEEKNKMTLEEYLASKKKGVGIKKEPRAHD